MDGPSAVRNKVQEYEEFINEQLKSDLKYDLWR